MLGRRMVAVLAAVAGGITGTGWAGTAVAGAGGAVPMARRLTVASPLTWSSARMIDPAHIAQFGYFGSISCPSATFCAATEQDSVLTYDGSSWSRPIQVVTANPEAGLSSVSCGSTSLCVAVGEAQLPRSFTFASVYDGKGWSRPVQLERTEDGPDSVSCPSATFCMVVTALGKAFTYNGTSWSAPVTVVSHPSFTLNSVSCPSAVFCVAVGEHDEVVTYANGTWAAPSAISQEASWLRSVSCASASLCVTVSLSGKYATYDGTTWSALTTIDSQGDLTGVSCAAATFCAAVDVDGNAFSYNGSAWSARRRVDKAFTYALSCPTAQFCVAAADTNPGGLAGAAEVVRYVDGIWAAPQIVDHSAGEPMAVSCPAPGRCVAADDNGDVIRYAGQRWGPPTPIDPNGYLRSVSCRLSFCMAVDPAGMAYVSNGSAWTARAFDTRNFPTAVSCTSPRFCVAVDSNGSAVVYRSGKWGKPHQVDKYGPESVSCPAVAFCAAVDELGHVVTYDGRAWSKPRLIDDRALLRSVSCSARWFCVAVDRAGRAVIFNGRAWRPGPRAAAGLFGLDSVSCPAAGFCVAVSYGGGVFVFRKGAWTASAKVSPLQSWTAVSCGSASFCAAVAVSGDGAIGTGR